MEIEKEEHEIIFDKFRNEIRIETWNLSEDARQARKVIEQVDIYGRVRGLAHFNGMKLICFSRQSMRHIKRFFPVI
jgi:hypothetical protein